MKIHTYYDNLKIVRTAPIGVIKASYRVLSQHHHPDKNNGSFESTHIMKIINKAYEVLSDPIQRAAYDEELRQKEAKAQQASSAQTKPPQSEPPAQEKPVKPPETPQSSQKGTGWVYILSNKTFPNLVKIGMTTKTPQERAKGLDNTGLPYRYVVEYKIRINNHHKLEQAVHRDMKYYREDKGKEFFRCTVEDAIKSINKIISNDTFNQYITPKKPVSQAEEANQWFKLGYAAYSKQDYQTAFNYYQKAAAQGDANAQCNLGYMYDANGHGVIKNESTAVEWYKKAAAQGHIVAQKNLLLIHEKNIKAQKEAELQKAAAAQKEAEFQRAAAAQKEAEFQRAAAAQKEAELQRAAAVQKEAELQKAAAVQKEAELQKAAAAHQKAVAAQKEVEQWFKLGHAAYSKQDYQTAFNYYQKAAAQGDANAQCNLGYMYDTNGCGVIKNESTAVEWYKKAAAQGHTMAQKNLLLIYEKNIKAQKEAELQKAAAAHQKSVAAQKEVEFQKAAAAEKEVEFQKAVAARKEAAFQKAAAAHQKALAAQKEVELQRAVAAQKEVEQWFNLGLAAYDIGNYVVALDKFQKAANQGNSKAQAYLGYMYDNGKGMDKNERTAVEWFQKAAAQGDVQAQNNLGVMYANGQGVVKNERTAVEWYTKAAEKGYVIAQFNLADMYEDGRGVIKNEVAAVKWYQKAAQQGNVYSQNKLSSTYEKNIKAQEEAGFQKSVAAQKEAEFQKVATEQEVVNKVEKAEQWFNLGMAAYNIQNYVIALDKFQKAANQGSAKAQYKLGVMYNNGYGIVKNERTAVEWFQKAADQGDAHAQYNLSLIHEKNIKAQKKVEFQKAAAAQKVVNQAEQLKQDTMTKTKVYISSNHKENDISNNWWLIIGFVLFFLCLLSISNNKTSIVRNDNNIIENTVVTSSLNNQTITTDTTLDDTESDEVKKIRLAAEGNTINEQGDAKAQYTLGVMYENGQSVVKNERTAVEWYTKAAEQGFAQAQYNLGVSYAKGLGVIKNMKTAYFWWLLASASGDEYAKNNIRVIENKINSEEKQVAQDAAANWRPKQ